MCRSQSELIKPMAVNLKYRIKNVNVHQTGNKCGKYMRKYLQLETNEQQSNSQTLEICWGKNGGKGRKYRHLQAQCFRVNADACCKKKSNAVMKSYGQDISVLILAILVIFVTSIYGMIKQKTVLACILQEKRLFKDLLIQLSESYFDIKLAVCKTKIQSVKDLMLSENNSLIQLEKERLSNRYTTNSMFLQCQHYCKHQHSLCPKEAEGSWTYIHNNLLLDQ